MGPTVAVFVTAVSVTAVLVAAVFVAAVSGPGLFTDNLGSIQEYYLAVTMSKTAVHALCLFDRIVNKVCQRSQENQDCPGHLIRKLADPVCFRIFALAFAVRTN